MAKVQNDEKVMVEKNTVEKEVSLSEVLALMQDMKSEIEKLKKENNNLKTANNSLQEEVEKNSFITTMENKKRTKDSEVTLIMNLQGRLDVSLPDLDLQMEKFGEQREITFQQFQQLMGKKRRWFEKDYLLVSMKDMDLVDKYKVKAYDPQSSSFMHYEDIEKFANMTGRELEEYYNKLSPSSQKGMLSLFLNKCYEQEPGFYSIEKMDALNRVSGTKTFDVLIREIQTKRDKEQQRK